MVRVCRRVLLRNINVFTQSCISRISTAVAATAIAIAITKTIAATAIAMAEQVAEAYEAAAAELRKGE